MYIPQASQKQKWPAPSHQSKNQNDDSIKPIYPYNSMTFAYIFRKKTPWRNQFFSEDFWFIILEKNLQTSNFPSQWFLGSFRKIQKVASIPKRLDEWKKEYSNIPIQPMLFPTNLWPCPKTFARRSQRVSHKRCGDTSRPPVTWVTSITAQPLELFNGFFRDVTPCLCRETRWSTPTENHVFNGWQPMDPWV